MSNPVRVIQRVPDKPMVDTVNDEKIRQIAAITIQHAWKSHYRFQETCRQFLQKTLDPAEFNVVIIARVVSFVRKLLPKNRWAHLHKKFLSRKGICLAKKPRSFRMFKSSNGDITVLLISSRLLYRSQYPRSHKTVRHAELLKYRSGSWRCDKAVYITTNDLATTQLFYGQAASYQLLRGKGIVATMPIVISRKGAYELKAFQPYSPSLYEQDLSLPQTISVMVKVTEMLHTMHELGFIHGNVRPTNISIEDGLNVFLSDSSDACKIGKVTAPYESNCPNCDESALAGYHLPSTDAYACACIVFQSAFRMVADYLLKYRKVLDEDFERMVLPEAQDDVQKEIAITMQKTALSCHELSLTLGSNEALRKKFRSCPKDPEVVEFIGCSLEVMQDFSLALRRIAALV